MMRLLVLVWLALVAAAPALTPSHVFAQTVTTEQERPDYDAWQNLADRAEDAVAAGRASNAALEDLRAELADWRNRFLAAQSINTTRIRTLRDQISALGPAPAEGESEPQEIADRRTELNRQLSELQAPGLRAVEAYSQADGLIQEIDNIIRERQAEELLELGPSPLNPVHWDNTLGALQKTLWDFQSEVAESWRTPSDRAEMRNNLPATVLFLAMAGLLLARGRRWMEMLTSLIVKKGDKGVSSLYAGVVSLGQIILPMAGLYLLTAALESSSLLGLRTQRFVGLLPQLGLTIFVARWLGGRVFAEDSVSRRIFSLAPDLQSAGRFNSGVLGVLLALAALVEAVASFNSFSPEAHAVVAFPVLLASGLMLARMGLLLVRRARADGYEAEERPYRNRIIHAIGRSAVAVGVGGPILAAIGYTKAAYFFVYPSILTLGLIGFLLVVQRFITDVYDYITGRTAREDEELGEALVPVLLGMLLSLLALPLLALIWGARVADLTELWSKFTAGFNVGGTRISPAILLTFVIVFGIGFTMTRALQGTLRSTVLPKTKIDPGGQQSLLSVIGYVGIFLALVVAVTTAGIDLSSLAIVAGALSVGIGFGLQTIVQNFVSGIILLLERPVSQGDWIEVGGTMGIVKEISVRSTRIETFDRTDVIVPNADLISGTVTNWTRQNLTGRVIITVGVAYGSDTRKVEKLLREIGENHPLVMVNPAPLIVFQGFGADALEFELRVILRDINYGLSVRTELNHEIARRFAEEGLEIPFAQRDIWLRNPEALRPAPAPVPSAGKIDDALPRQAAEPQPDPRPDLVGSIDDGDMDGGDSR